MEDSVINFKFSKVHLIHFWSQLENVYVDQQLLPKKKVTGKSEANLL